MTDNEQLLIISNMLDKKLSPLELRMEFIERRLDRLEDHLTRQIKLLDLKIDYLSKKSRKRAYHHDMPYLLFLVIHKLWIYIM